MPHPFAANWFWWGLIPVWRSTRKSAGPVIPHVEVHHADGASWDPRGLFAEAPVKFPWQSSLFRGGGAILQNFLSRPSAVERAVVMLQKEFIDRILATPDDDAFGLLSLRIQKNWIPRALKTIPPEAFHPRPRIDSTVMLLTPPPCPRAASI